MPGRRLDQPLINDDYVTQLIRRSRERTHTLGDICKWDIQGVEIPPDELFALLTKYGLERWTPVQINPKTAARKAITRVKDMLEDPGSDIKILSRRVPTLETDVIRYAIIEESVDLARLDLDYSTLNQLVFRSDTNTIEFTGDTIPEIVDMFDYLCSVYTDVELNLMISNIVNNHGCIWMNDRSGMFFMGHPHKELVDRLLLVFEDLRERTKKACYFRPLALLDDEENRNTMGEALIADIGAELQDATEYLDRAISDESKKTLNAALARFRIAKSKAQLYQDMLNINMTGIIARVDDADAKASALMTRLAEKKANKT